MASRWMLTCIAIVAVTDGAAADDCSDTGRKLGRCTTAPAPPVQTPQPIAPTAQPAPPRPAPRPANAKLDLQSGDAMISGARVELDGRPVGTMPTTIEVTPGRHQVRVDRGATVFYEEWLDVKAGAALSIVLGTCADDMIHIPAATFAMGDDDNTPIHRVTLSGYCIDRTEVTVAAFARCAAAKGCDPAPTTPTSLPPGITDTSSHRAAWDFCNGEREDRANHPVNCVNWAQAAAYCKWAHKRLPTEAEWEHAARGDRNSRYPWGTDLPSAQRLNGCGVECRKLFDRYHESGSVAKLVLFGGDDHWEATAPVGSFPDGASQYGLLDMAGNVWEWTADWYGKYSSGDATNPTGPSSGERRVIRGGGMWDSNNLGDRPEEEVRAAHRHLPDPNARQMDIGFRCARGE